MDFFEHQERAKTRTTLLVVYFVLAVALITALIYLVVAALFEHETNSLWDPALFAGVSVAVLAVVTAGSLFKIMTLSGGGHVVAEMFGGRLVPRDTHDPIERRLLNVVEEMAIAASVPVPPVYIMDGERGINAFAAGYAPGDAIVAVTRGTLELLSRDELQGVMAHEFSHILHGDMRLNIRLMGVLNGILLISLIGYFILRATTTGRMYARDDGKRGGSPLPLLGIALYILGYVGVFFGKLIKAAVSRQREFLADASAVQYTRHAEGIAGALRKIGGVVYGSRIKSPHAEEASHMFFGNGLGISFSNLLSTHPPLDERIRRIDPTFDGTFPSFDPADLRGTSMAEARSMFGQGAAGFAGDPAERGHEPVYDAAIVEEPRRAGPIVAPMAPPTANDVVDRVGKLDQQAIDYAENILSRLPNELVRATRDPLSATALVYLLLLDDDATVRRAQLAVVNRMASSGVRDRFAQLLESASLVTPAARLPLVDLALPSLKTQSAAQLDEFRECAQALIAADQRIGLFEYVLQRVVLNHLRRDVPSPSVAPPAARTTDALSEASALVLTAVAQAGRAAQGQAERAFDLGVARLTMLGRPLRMVPRDKIALRYFEEALTVLEDAPPKFKKQFLLACGTCISADQRLTVEEVELVRVVADALGCPIAPMVADA